MGEFSKELERAQRRRKLAQKATLKIMRGLFKVDAENSRLQRDVEAMEAGDIPGAIPTYKPE
jgi:hypothetical protein